jgi:hypothetical protein
MEFTFANTEIENRANTLKSIINDGGKFTSVEIEATTSVSLQPKKNGCPYGTKDKVKSLKEYSCNLNGIYQNMINNRKEKEGQEANFESRSNWHVKLYDGINGTIVAKKSEVENNLPITEVYLLVSTKYAKVTKYYLQGKEATEQEIATIKKFKKDRKVEASKSQGLSVENAVIVSTIASSNIHEIRANKQVLNF